MSAHPRRGLTLLTGYPPPPGDYERALNAMLTDDAVLLHAAVTAPDAMTGPGLDAVDRMLARCAGTPGPIDLADMTNGLSVPQDDASTARLAERLAERRRERLQ